MDEMPTFRMEGFNSSPQPMHGEAMSAVVEALFARVGYPQLKSDIVHIVNEPERSFPLYCAGIAEERILIASPGNYPWQFAYQLAHELGHMSARADLRFPRRDGLNWVKRILAEAHSLIALRRMADAPGPLQHNAIIYDGALHRQNREVGIDAEWFTENAERLSAMNSLNELGKALARHLFDRVPHDRILRDNRLLLELGTGEELPAFLENWIKIGGGGASVPATLAEFVRRDHPR